MEVQNLPLESIKPYDSNPRRNDEAIDFVARSIQQYGFRQPIVVDKDMVIVVGHTRYKAALKLGLATIPVHVARDLTPEQAKAYRIADNRSHELSEWDDEKLIAELKALATFDIDLDDVGFDSADLQKLIAENSSTFDDDDVPIPEPPDEATTKLGDIWILGDHRLMCGDSASVEDVDRLLAGAKIQLVNTDPPYNVKVEPRSNNARAMAETHHQRFDNARSGNPTPTDAKLRPKDRPLMNDFMSDADFDEILLAWFGNIARVLEPGRGFYIWGGYANLGNYPAPLKALGLYFSQCIVWDKEHPVLTRKDFMGAYEICFYGWKEGAAHRYFGPNNATDLWHIKKVNPQSMIHLTEKPVALAARAIEFSSLEGENVLELFGGSGSTLIACEKLKRRCYAMELDELYCDVIVKRWEEFTGCKAVPVQHVTPAHAAYKKGGE